jgi:hypothetical protein
MPELADQEAKASWVSKQLDMLGTLVRGAGIIEEASLERDNYTITTPDKTTELNTFTLRVSFMPPQSTTEE